MKNNIRTDGKIYKIKNKSLVSGEIECISCGDWVYFEKLRPVHFKKEFFCKTCKTQMKKEPIKKERVVTKKSLPLDCAHRQFFGCKRPSECTGCYYNPDWEMARIQIIEGGEQKTKKDHWFYGDKKHVERCLKLLDDIKRGVGLMKGGTRCYFKFLSRGED